MLNNPLCSTTRVFCPFRRIWEVGIVAERRDSSQIVVTEAKRRNLSQVVVICRKLSRGAKTDSELL